MNQSTKVYVNKRTGEIVNADGTPIDSKQTAEQKEGVPLTAAEIQASWQRAFAAVSQS